MNVAKNKKLQKIIKKLNSKQSFVSYKQIIESLTYYCLFGSSISKAVLEREFKKNSLSISIYQNAVPRLSKIHRRGLSKMKKKNRVNWHIHGDGYGSGAHAPGSHITKHGKY